MVSISLALLGLVYIFAQWSLAMRLGGGWRLAAIAPAPCLLALVATDVAVGLLGAGQGGGVALLVSLPLAVVYFALLSAAHLLWRLRVTTPEGTPPPPL